MKDSESKIELTIELNSNEGRTRSTYRVYVWNESNGTIDLLQSDGRISMTYRESDPLQNTYPLSATKVLKIPKVYTSSTTNISPDRDKQDVLRRRSAYDQRHIYA